MRFFAAMLTGLLFCLAGPVFFVFTALIGVGVYFELRHRVPAALAIHQITSWIDRGGPPIALAIAAVLALLSAFAGGVAIARILPKAPYDCCTFVAFILFGAAMVLGLAAPGPRLWLVAIAALIWVATIYLGARLGRPRGAGT
ncbi:MAG: hypothetical protein IPK59_17025 [Rhodospirillaceae bacterium]|nr:hypothetical protein [Rhodospirillaceae bacterium]